MKKKQKKIKIYKMKIEQIISFEKNKAIFSILPCPFKFLECYLNNMKISSIDNIYIAVFNPQNEDDYYHITIHNYLEKIGEVLSINDLANYLKSIGHDSYNIHLFDFTIDNIKYLYDDDSYLIVKISFNNFKELNDFVQNISSKYWGFVLKNEIIDLI